MGRFLVSDDEELVRSWRPHPFSFAASYASAFWWLAFAAGAYAAQQALAADWRWLAWVLLLLLAATYSAVRARLRKDRRAWALGVVAMVWVGVAMGLDGAGLLLPADLARYNLLLAGAAMTLASLLVREATRLAESTYVTTVRVVTRRGLAPRREIILLIKDLSGVQTLQGVLGSVFGFGRIQLVRGRRRLKRKTKKEEIETEEDDVVELRGVPRFERARRDLNSLVHEVKLAPKERQKRVEERRLKDSMVRLSQWKPRQRD